MLQIVQNFESKVWTSANQSGEEEEEKEVGQKEGEEEDERELKKEQEHEHEHEHEVYGNQCLPLSDFLQSRHDVTS